MSAQRNEQQAKYKHSSKYQRHTSQSKTKQIKHLIYSFTPTYFPQTWRRVAQKANQNTLKKHTRSGTEENGLQIRRLLGFDPGTFRLRIIHSKGIQFT